MAGTDLMSLLFGKKRRRRTTRKSRKTTTKTDKPKRPKGLTAALRKQARKYKVKTRLMRNGKHVGYRKLTHIKRDIRKKKKAAERRAKSAKKTTTRRRRRVSRRSGFGVGGSYMPLSNFMSSYPYAVDSSPPWI